MTSPLVVAGAVAAGFTMAVSQPLLELLGRNVEFFVARGAPGTDVVLLAVVLAIALPALLVGVVLVAARIAASFGSSLLLLFMGILGGAVTVRILDAVLGGSVGGWAKIAGGVAGGAALAACIAFSASIRSVLRFGVILPLVVVVQFLVFSDAPRVTGQDEVPVARPGTVSDPAPIVMLLLDELPLVSLLDRDGEIDGAFPNFRRLAADATWYRNATTAHFGTATAVPAVLDGSLPQADGLPTASDHPRNLFTLLGGDYDVVAEELVTRLCPPSICPPPREPAVDRWQALAGDVAVLTGHVALPRDLTRGLPAVDDAWGDFGAGEHTGARPPGVRTVVGKGDPPRELEGFIDRIEARRTPTLYFKHVMLPHSPWRYLPTGEAYQEETPMPGTVPIPGRAGTKWGEDEWLVAQAYQRHLLQTMLVDRLLGRLLDRLEEIGIYERALVVVTSDHGTAFVPGVRRRSANPRTLGAIAPVPLFVKGPGQDRGKIDDRPAVTIDLLPTIVDILGVEGAGGFDGNSLLGDVVRTERRYITIRRRGPGFSLDGAEKTGFVAEKYELFGRDGSLDPFALAPEGTRPLLGSTVPSRRTAGGTVRFDDPQRFEDVNRRNGILPALVTGTLQDLEGEEPPVIAVTLNGTVRAVTRAYRDGPTWRFQAMLPAQAFREGSNELGALALRAQDDRYVVEGSLRQ